MTKEEINQRLQEIIGHRLEGVGQGCMCLTCHPGPNSLAEVQDLLEDMGIPVERFVSTVNQIYRGEVLRVERGRLRIRDLGQCIEASLLGKNFIFSLAGLDE